MARTPLSRDRIVEAAVALLDQDGLAGLTARALAARLGVQAGAIYHHLPDMRSVVDAVATELLREMQGPRRDADPGPGDPGFAEAGTWSEMLRAYGSTIRAVLLRHRDGARVFAGSRIGDPSLLERMEAPLALLGRAGFDPTHAVWLLQSVLHYSVGFVIEEQHRSDEAASYDPDARAARFDADRTPLVVGVGAALATDPDDQFTFGLELIIDGAAAVLVR